MFLKNSPPPTTRQKLWFGAICTAGVVLTGAILTLDYWTTNDISERVTHIDGKPIDIRHVSVWIFNCDQEHSIGRSLIFRDDDAIPGPPGRAGDIYMQPGRACWDWKAINWVAHHP